MEITWRPLAPDDVPAWTRLLAEVESVDRTGEHYDEADLREELDDPATGPLDRTAGWSGGDLVAYAGVRPRQTVTDHWRVDAEGSVHPRRRGGGLGSHLIAWTLQRARQLQAERHPGVETRVLATAYLDNAGHVSLLEADGFKAVNWSATMRVRLDGRQSLPAEPAWPGGFSVAPYELSRSSATLEAHNSAFLDHWGFVPWSPTMWRQWEDDSKNARHDMSWVVLPSGQPELVVGYCLSHEYDAYQSATGRREAYLAKLGVRREFRGRGIASSLLSHALRRYAEAGYDESSLDVDTNNPTGAFGLYERVGYRTERRTATFEHRLF